MYMFVCQDFGICGYSWVCATCPLNLKERLKISTALILDHLL